MSYDNYDTLGPGYGVSDSDLCTATAPPALASGEDLCWLPDGHEGFHKSLAQTGPGWRVWVEWSQDPHPYYARRKTLGMNQKLPDDYPEHVRQFMDMMKSKDIDIKDWRCAETTVFWPDMEACEAVCVKYPGHEGPHEDEILGEWNED